MTRCKEDEREPLDQIERARKMPPYRFAGELAGWAALAREKAKGLGPRPENEVAAVCK